jgi:3-oxoacyl-[acyl-carrier protein] reductase
VATNRTFVLPILGGAIAQNLSREGADVAICSRQQENVDATITAFSDYPGKVIGDAVDATDPEGFKEWVDSAWWRRYFHR